MQYHALPCNTMRYHAIPCNNMQYHAIPGNTMQFHAVQCITMQYFAIPSNTKQYHASLITADGAYHCPVGSIIKQVIVMMSIMKKRGPVYVLYAFKIFSLPVPTCPGDRTFWQVPNPSHPKVKNPYPSGLGTDKNLDLRSLQFI